VPNGERDATSPRGPILRRIRSGRPVMPVEMITYAAFSERLGSAEAARALVKRLRCPGSGGCSHPRPQGRRPWSRWH
jgi:hypothetical protein